jgi:hypothetical protein
MALRQISDGGPDGTVVGQSATDKVGFYGTTPVARTTVTLTTSSTTGNLRIDIDAIHAALRLQGML